MFVQLPTSTGDIANFLPQVVMTQVMLDLEVPQLFGPSFDQNIPWVLGGHQKGVKNKTPKSSKIHVYKYIYLYIYSYMY